MSSKTWLLVAGTVVFVVAALGTSRAADRTFNDDWRFRIGTASGAHSVDFDDSEWQNVRLPHTARVEALVTGTPGSETSQWQGVCWYRKTFASIPAVEDATVLLKLGAAMRAADVWLNNQWIGSHLGGYLPAVFDITEYVNASRSNCLAIRLNNFDNPVSGPKPLANLDFNFYGGLYRGAELIVKDRIRISDPLNAKRRSSGGVFVTFPKVESDEAVIEIKTHLINDRSQQQTAVVRNVVFDRDGEEVCSVESEPVAIEGNSEQEVVHHVSLADPKLWSPHRPYLYTIRTQLIVKELLIDEELTRVGIRRIHITKDGLWVNGEKMFLRGVNRHQEYPYVGYALSDNAQYRDAKRIKDAGFDFVRLSHYPQSPAFLDACDELGLFVANCIMGWQYFSSNPEFVTHQYQQCRELIRRDRNHPCVLLWEMSLNESPMPQDFMQRVNEIAHDEYPGDQCYTSGWHEGYDVFIEARQHGGCRKVHSRPCVVSEYGDWEYYAQNAGFAQEKWQQLKPQERSSRQDRTSGEGRLLQQVRNFQEAHNDNLKTSAFADGLWVMFDYNRGYSDDLETSGCMDIFRLPKPSYYFFQSQRNPNERLSHSTCGPMVHIVPNWSEWSIQPDDSSRQVVIFSNCEKVELRVNDTPVEERTADEDRFGTHLSYPPFTFVLPPSIDVHKLQAIGKISEHRVANHIRRSPSVAERVRVKVDLCGRDLDCSQNDVVFVHAIATDENGNTVNDPREVRFQVDGPAELIGENPTCFRAGIATVLLRAGSSSGTIEITASAEGLSSDTFAIDAINCRNEDQ